MIRARTPKACSSCGCRRIGGGGGRPLLLGTSCPSSIAPDATSSTTRPAGRPVGPERHRKAIFSTQLSATRVGWLRVARHFRAVGARRDRRGCSRAICPTSLARRPIGRAILTERDPCVPAPRSGEDIRTASWPGAGRKNEIIVRCRQIVVVVLSTTSWSPIHHSFVQPRVPIRSMKTRSAARPRHRRSPRDGAELPWSQRVEPW